MKRKRKIRQQPLEATAVAIAAAAATSDSHSNYYHYYYCKQYQHQHHHLLGAPKDYHHSLIRPNIIYDKNGTFKHYCSNIIDSQNKSLLCFRNLHATTRRKSVTKMSTTVIQTPTTNKHHNTHYNHHLIDRNDSHQQSQPNAQTRNNRLNYPNPKSNPIGSSPLFNSSCKHLPIRRHQPAYRVDMSDFELLKVLGTGAYGKVFLVRKLTGHDKGKLYAMKVLRKEIVAQKAKTLDHTRTERKVLESIRNEPFLVTMHYAFQTKSKLHLILDYVNGGELFTHLYQRDHFKEDDVKIYIAELILALEKLHNVSICQLLHIISCFCCISLDCIALHYIDWHSYFFRQSASI